MADDSNFASFRRRYRLNAASVTNLLSVFRNGRTESEIEPPLANASSLAAEPATSSHNEDEEEAIEEVQREPIEEPFITLYRELREDLGLNGYPRLLTVEDFMREFSVEDEFSNETQKRMHDMLLAYLDFHRAPAPRMCRGNFSLAIPPRGIVDVSPVFFEASPRRPDLVTISFKGGSKKKSEVWYADLLNHLRFNAALAIDAPPKKALWSDTTLKAIQEMDENNFEKWMESFEKPIEEPKHEASLYLEEEEKLPTTFGIFQEYLKLKKPTETQVQRLQNFMDHLMKSFTWDNQHVANQVWQGRGEGRLDIERQCQDVALTNFLRRNEDGEQTESIFLPDRDDPLVDGVKLFLREEKWVQEAIAEDFDLCLKDIMMWLIQRPMGLETLRGRWRWDLQIAHWKHDRLVRRKRDVRNGMRVQGATTFGADYSQEVLNRLKKRRSQRTETWGTTQERARWDAENEVLRQREKVEMVNHGSAKGLNDDDEYTTKVLEDLHKRLSVAEDSLREYSYHAGDSESEALPTCESSTGPSTKPSDREPFEWDEEWNGFRSQSEEFLGRLNGVSASSKYSRSTMGRPQSYSEDNIDEPDDGPEASRLSRSLADARRRIPPLHAIMEDFRTTRPTSYTTEPSMSDAMTDNERRAGDLGQRTPTQHDFDPSLEPLAHRSAGSSANPQIFATPDEIPSNPWSQEPSSNVQVNSDELQGTLASAAITAVGWNVHAGSQSWRSPPETPTRPQRTSVNSLELFSESNETAATENAGGSRVPRIPLQEVTGNSVKEDEPRKAATTEKDKWSSWMSLR